MKLIKEIREQPIHIRKLFMWSLVTVSFSFVGMLWFNDTKSNVLALIGEVPSQQVNQEAESVASPFAMLGKSWKGLRAQISGLFSDTESVSETVKDQPKQATVAPQSLPVE